MADPIHIRAIQPGRAETNSTGSTDMAPLIEGVHAWIADQPETVVSHTLTDFDPVVSARRIGLAPRRKGKAEVILGSDVAVELGHPSTASLACLLTTTHGGLVRPRRISRIGPDLDQASPGDRWPFGQVVMLELRPGSRPDPYDLDSAQFLISRLSGYMVRSIPGRLWVRVSRRRSGLLLGTVGEALVATYEGDFAEVVHAEVLHVTSSAEAVEALAPTALEASVVTGRHKRLFLDPEGELDCVTLNCERCDEKPVCDDLREILRQRRKRR